MRGRVRLIVLVGALALLTGCTTPPSASVGVVFPTFSPRREAFSYFPATAPVVVLVATDPQDPGVRRLATSGALAPLDRALKARHLDYDHFRGVLGNDLVVGQPSVGADPLAVLVTDHSGELDALAQARVINGDASEAGEYRGAQLYAERGWAFAVRDRVLIVGRRTRDLLSALDTRVGDHAFEAVQLNDVLPAHTPPATFVRAFVNLRPFVAQAGAAGRAVGVLQALTTAGVSIGATATEFQAVMDAETAGSGLTPADLPALVKAGGRRPSLPPYEPALAVADLAPLAVAAERALRAASPGRALQVDAIRARLRGAGVTLTPDLLHGAAAVVLAAGGPQLRLQPERPNELRAALERAARRLRSPRLRITREADFYVVRSRDRIQLRVGFVDGALVAGRAPAAELAALARQPLVGLQSPALARLPAVGRWYPRPVVFTLAGTPDRLRLEAFSGF